MHIHSFEEVAFAESLLRDGISWKPKCVFVFLLFRGFIVNMDVLLYYYTIS